MYNPPPAGLNDREIVIRMALDSEIWYRSHQTNCGPVFFGKSKTQRWDAPGGEYGVLYLGADPYCVHGVDRTRRAQDPLRPKSAVNAQWVVQDPLQQRLAAYGHGCIRRVH